MDIAKSIYRCQCFLILFCCLLFLKAKSINTCYVEALYIWKINVLKKDPKMNHLWTNCFTFTTMPSKGTLYRKQSSWLKRVNGALIDFLPLCYCTPLSILSAMGGFSFLTPYVQVVYIYRALLSVANVFHSHLIFHMNSLCEHNISNTKITSAEQRQM